jgi:TolA-binding protein
MLIVRLIETKQYSGAETALEQYVEYFPQDDRMRQALARAKANSPQP